MFLESPSYSQLAEVIIIGRVFESLPIVTFSEVKKQLFSAVKEHLKPVQPPDISTFIVSLNGQTLYNSVLYLSCSGDAITR